MRGGLPETGQELFSVDEQGKFMEKAHLCDVGSVRGQADTRRMSCLYKSVCERLKQLPGFWDTNYNGGEDRFALLSGRIADSTFLYLMAWLRDDHDCAWRQSNKLLRNAAEQKAGQTAATAPADHQNVSFFVFHGIDNGFCWIAPFT